MKRSNVIGVIAVAAASALLLAHARVFDFFCDDAFITLRFAQNFALHGAPVYNLGERVEGYTSPLFMGLVALGITLGTTAEGAAHVLGAASGVAIVASTWLLWRRIEPGRPLVGMLVLAAIAGAAPVAAWTLGGLEAPLFGAFVALSIVVASRAIVVGNSRAGFGAGLLLAVTTLTRPEGLALTAVVVLVGLALERRQRRTLVAVLVGYLLVMGPFEAWRWSYYGYPLPNTFYVKTSGGMAVFGNGLRYVQLFLLDIGVPLSPILLVAFFAPASSAAPDTDGASPERRAALWMCRGFVLVILPYVASIGGDFLDLYRFFVPIVPLIFVGATHGLVRLVTSWAPGRYRAVAVASVLVATLPAFAWRERAMGQQARQLTEEHRESLGIEPIGWTRLYSLRWGATGRWVAAHARPDDSMATGAAGAMPFYAGLSNLDMLGLCDEWVAHHGEIFSTRPGHQRESTEGHTLSKHPVFLFLLDRIEEEYSPPKRDVDWESKGYVWIVATIDAKKYGAPETFYHHFLMRTDRARQLLGSEDLQTALGLPE